MKHLGFLLLAFTIVLVSCRHAGELIEKTTLPIIHQYIPEGVLFQRSDTEFVDKIKWLDEKKFIISSDSEFPDDGIGFSNAYKGIDFSRYTLLLYYRVHDWRIDTYENWYYRNNIENTYNWNIHLGTSTIPDSGAETLRFTRLAILVQKIPENVDVNIMVVLGAINFGWED